MPARPRPRRPRPNRPSASSSSPRPTGARPSRNARLRRPWRPTSSVASCSDCWAVPRITHQSCPSRRLPSATRRAERVPLFDEEEVLLERLHLMFHSRQVLGFEGGGLLGFLWLGELLLRRRHETETLEAFRRCRRPNDHIEAAPECRPGQPPLL